MLVVAATPLLSLATLVHDGSHTFLAGAADLDGLALAPAAFAASICIYLAWRISNRPAFAWLAAGGAMVGIQGLTVASLQLTDADLVRRQAFWMAVCDASLLVAVSIVGASLARRFVGHPATLGAVGGLILGLFRLVAVTQFPTVDLTARGIAPILAGFLVFVLPPAWLLSGARTIPVWACWRFAEAVVLFGLAHLATYLDPDRTALGALATLSCDLLSVVALSSAAIVLVRQAILMEETARDGLREKLDAMEDDVRRDHARLHEITSTVAGVQSASRLLREDCTLDLDRRRLLDDMVHEELCRLARMLGPADVNVPAPRTADLDAAIANLALSHGARGHRVVWRPSGARVSAAPDAVAEVLNILLDNAAKHGSGDALVEVASGAGDVEIMVSDNGCGIPPEMRSSVFEWGVRGPRSGGKGIGLTIAEQLARSHGGYLRLQDDAGQNGPRRGTTFVVGFPAAAVDGHEQQPRFA